MTDHSYSEDMQFLAKSALWPDNPNPTQEQINAMCQEMLDAVRRRRRELEAKRRWGWLWPIAKWFSPSVAA